MSKTPHSPSGKTAPTPPGKAPEKVLPKEIGGRKGPEPTRYGDWEKDGIISDF